MKVARSAAELPGEGEIGLVPTMGAFHEGHLALLRAAREENELVVASLFVNAAQFGEGEDLARYPRDEARDAELAVEAGVDVLYIPEAAEIYPPGFETWVEVERLGAMLEGEYRPGHFRGVATVCLKLFNLVQPRRAYFGQKDAQQVAVVRRMVRDLAVPVEIRVVPTVRDADGLALSSRNAYLSPGERQHALALPRALEAARTAILAGTPVFKAIHDAHATLRDAGFSRIDYFELVDQTTLEPVEEISGKTRLIAAAVIGTTRLIDNLAI